MLRFVTLIRGSARRSFPPEMDVGPSFYKVRLLFINGVIAVHNICYDVMRVTFFSF